ncbi:MAG: guanylate kinase [Anaerolineae bacterium]|nr:guanylate kinase [Anaerolineae bacterium]
MMVSAYPGILFALIGPAGAGKNTVMDRVLASQANIRQLATATTRGQRAGEMEGREHYFVSRDRFETMLREGALLEHAIVHGEYYGIPRAPLEAALRNGELLFADVDMLGAQAARTAFPDNVILVFVQPPSLSALVERMRESRGETEAQIGRRLLRAPSEMAFAPQCDYIITNDSLEQATGALMAIVTAELARRTVRQLAQRPPRPLYMDACAVVTYHGQAVVTEADRKLPSEAFALESMPHVAAFHAATRSLASVPASDAFTTLDEATDGYIPPVYVEDDSNTDEDRFRYFYVLRFSTPLDPARGYRLVDLSALSLPVAVREAVGEPAMSDER